MVTPMCSQLTYEGVIDEVLLLSNIIFCTNRYFHVTSTVLRNLQYITSKSSWNSCAFHRLWLLCPSLDFFKLKLKDFFGVNVYFKSCIWLQFIQINNGAVELEPSVMGAQPNSQASTRKVKVPLNSRYCLCCFRLICSVLCQSFGMCLRQSET